MSDTRAVSRRDLFRNRALMGLLARDIVSVTGSQMTWIALPWFVLTTTGSPARMTIVLAVESAALALAGLASGTIVARLGPRRTMLVADLVRAPLIAAVPVLHALDSLSFGLLLVLVVAVTAPALPSYSAKTSLLPDLVHEDEALLAEANALVQAANRVTMIAGPAFGGALIAVVGATNVLLIDSLTFLAGFVLVAILVPVVGHVPARKEERSLRAGVRFLWREPLLRPWTGALVVSDVAFIVLFATLPVLVIDRFGERPELLGWIWGAWGLGAVIGSVVAFRIVGSIDRLLVGSLGEIFMILPLWLLLAGLPPAGLVVAMAASGLANGIVNAPLHAIIQLRTPRVLRATVIAVIISLTAGLGPVALAAAGPVLESVGWEPVLLTLLAVQTMATAAFTTAGLRERARGARFDPLQTADESA